MTEPEIPRISGVKIAENAKHEPVVTVHGYIGTTYEDLAETRDITVRIYEETVRAVRG